MRQGDTIPPKIFTVTLENAIQKQECDDMEAKVGGRQLCHLSFVNDIALIPSSIKEPKHMLAESKIEARGRISLKVNDERR
ncbi:hypothetical protein RB195_022477 [Necator americanus]|uniref:Reverse transcriptase domain-containing protein n=1 Tax=Necator americanus TaxID=51031 RepID=A0ABR1EFQ6_NECAM